MAQEVQELTSLVQGAGNLVAFTGAGISTESGIPDFRSPGGIWSRYTPVTYPEFLSSAEARENYWRRHLEMHPVFSGVSPNDGHRALAVLEKKDVLSAVITQNVDRLHQAAGNSDEKVIELHGRVDITTCLSCGEPIDTELILEKLQARFEITACTECGGFMKPATISFGQSLPPDVLQRAFQFARQADIFLAVGSSLTVHPAASLPGLALENGAKLVILNVMPTPYDQHAHLVINSRAGSVLRAVIEGLGWSL